MPGGYRRHLRHLAGLAARTAAAAELPTTASATILPIHLLPPARGTGPVGLRQVRTAISVGPRPAIVAAMANAVAPPAIAIGHRLEVGLESGCRPQNISRAAHAGLRCNRVASKHEGATRHDQKLQLHLGTSLLGKKRDCGECVPRRCPPAAREDARASNCAGLA